jgi:mono/diheme cytochrome c family protein
MQRSFRSIAAIIGRLFAAVATSAVIVGATLGFAHFMQARRSPTVANPGKLPAVPAGQPLAAQGAKLFSFNCAHCHSIDATGDEGPDLYGLTKSDTRLKAIILGGVKGEMPSFSKKLKTEDVQALVAFLRTLKG